MHDPLFHNYHLRLTRIDFLACDILVGAATCSEGFVICFLKVSLACLGSMAAAVQPKAWGTLRKQFTKPSEQVAAPPSTMYFVIVNQSQML